jgi:hypothetical protein
MELEGPSVFGQQHATGQYHEKNLVHILKPGFLMIPFIIDPRSEPRSPNLFVFSTLKHKFYLNNFQNSVSSSQGRHYSAIENDKVMLFTPREISVILGITQIA